jgi:hypothetical protein
MHNADATIFEHCADSKYTYLKKQFCMCFKFVQKV